MPPMNPIRFRIGTRGSRLALAQTRQVQAGLQARFPDVDVQIHIIHTLGDQILDKGLSQIGDKGLFTSELERALLEGEVDLAVHSMKDVPGTLPPQLTLAAILPRENPADVFISSKYASWQELPQGAILGTSSLRRTAQLKHLRPDVHVVNLRGSVETRLRKMEEQHLDGILLAWAGIRRLGLEENVRQILPWDDMLPAVGQGAIGVETHVDSPLFACLQQLDDPITHACVQAERAFLQRLEGGCQAPLAALARYQAGKIHLKGRILSLSGDQLFASKRMGEVLEAPEIGRKLAEELLAQGAQAVLEEIRRSGGGAK